MIILLNGASSAGKSSIAKELQLILDDLFLNMSMDKFMSMVPVEYQGMGIKAAPMWSWEKSFDDKGELLKLKLGDKGKSYVLGVYESVVIMAKRKFNIIVDDVCLDKKLLQQIAVKLSPFKVYFIGVSCKIDILEKRERLRGNRVINTARAQHNIVHCNYSYDFMVDTSENSAKNCALQIKEFIKENSDPQAFKNISGEL